jgi:hypothetical protein
MSEHQERVVQEREELGAKIERLDAFLDGEAYRGLDEAEQRRLIQQRHHMGMYSDALLARIKAFS